MKICQIAQTIHSSFCRENCVCPPQFAVNGYAHDCCWHTTAEAIWVPFSYQLSYPSNSPLFPSETGVTPCNGLNRVCGGWLIACGVCADGVRIYHNPAMELLLVQDGDDFCDTVVRWMVRHGHRVAERASGQEGLALITQRQFDVAILDANLPDLSGLDLLQEISCRKSNVERMKSTSSCSRVKRKSSLLSRR